MVAADDLERLHRCFAWRSVGLYTEAYKHSSPSCFLECTTMAPTHNTPDVSVVAGPGPAGATPQGATVQLSIVNAVSTLSTTATHMSTTHTDTTSANTPIIPFVTAPPPPLSIPIPPSQFYQGTASNPISVPDDHPPNGTSGATVPGVSL